MGRTEILSGLVYNYTKGPVSLKELQTNITDGNCRLAVQDYFLRNHELYLSRSELVLPEALEKEDLVKSFKDDNTDFFYGLKDDDIIYADKLRNSHGKEFKPISERFKTEEERMIHLHMGIYTRGSVWHSSYISRGTDLWSIEKFCYYYQPFIARRIINHDESQNN